MAIRSSKISTGLPQTPEGVPPELFAHFLQVYQAFGNLADALSQYAGVDSPPTDWWSQLTFDDTFYDGNMNRLIVKCNEAIAFGQLVSPIFIAGELQVRLANASTNARWACGFCITAGAHAIGERIEIKTRGYIDGIIGMAPSARYFLSTVNGAIQAGAPVAAGNIEQVVGWAVASNRLISNLDTFWIQH